MFTNQAMVREVSTSRVIISNNISIPRIQNILPLLPIINSDLIKQKWIDIIYCFIVGSLLIGILIEGLKAIKPEK